MLRTDKVTDDGVDLIDEQSREVIVTVWRADGEKDEQLTIRAGNIARCVNDEIRRNRK